MTTRPSTVESYIAQFALDIQQRLYEIRTIGFDIFAVAEETIYHRVPTFMIDGRDVLSYGAYKDHITLYIGYDMADFLKNVYPQYRYTKSALQIPHGDGFPGRLIQEVCWLLRVAK